MGKKSLTSGWDTSMLSMYCTVVLCSSVYSSFEVVHFKTFDKILLLVDLFWSSFDSIYRPLSGCPTENCRQQHCVFSFEGFG